MKKPIIAFVAICLVLTAAVILTKRIASKDEIKTMTVKTYTIAKAWWPVWDMFQIGVEQHEMDKNPFKTIFLQKEDYGSALDEFIKGKADAATLTIYEAILAASHGIPLKIILLLDYTIGSDAVIAKKNIRSLLDLSGKRIGVEKGTIAHFTALKMLEKAGLAKTDVQIVDLNLQTLQKAFINSEVDAAAIYEPYMSDMVRQGEGHILFSSKEIPRTVCDVLFVKRDVLKESPDIINHWIKGWDNVLMLKEKEPKKLLEMLTTLNHTPASDIKRSFEGIFIADLSENRFAFGHSAGGEYGYLLTSLKEMGKFMLKEGVIQKEVVIEELLK